MTKTKISFKRDDLTLIGNLFTTKNFDESKQYNAIIVQGSFTSVKEQMSNLYAQKFADNGFIVLAFDYSHYGASEGNPRQLDAPEEKLQDLKAATLYLYSLPYVKAITMVGVCTSGGNAAYLAANDNRIKAVATVAAFLPDAALNVMMFGEKEIARKREDAASARRVYAETGKAPTVPAYVEAIPGMFDYYLNKNRGGIPEYKNETTVMSLDAALDFDPISQASFIKIPMIMVHSDGCAFPDQVKKFYALLSGKKELVWGDGNHFDYYDQPAQVDFAVKNVTRFFKENL